MNASIVIPCYNSEQYIERCLAALNKQSIKPKEIIVIDSSTDSTTDIIRQKFPNVQLHHMQQQTMPGAARNIGISLATGDIIIFTDSDAIAEPDWIENHLKLHHDNPDIVLLGGSILNQNPEHLFSRLSYISEFTGYFRDDNAGERSIVPSVNMSIKREELKHSGVLMPESSLPGGEEVFFCNELIRKGYQIRFNPLPAIKHINRTTWKAYTSHMKSSGFGAGIVASEHKVNFDFLTKLGPLAILAAPVRLLLVMKRLFRTDKQSFIESILYSPLLLWGMLVHMWHYYLGATNAKPAQKLTALIIPLVVIITATFILGINASKRISSDPSCYLNYAKMLTHGNMFFDSLAAETVYVFGGDFKESVMHGYVFANNDNKLYPFVTIGFPAILAVWIKIAGLENAVLINILLLPLFLFLYMLILYRLIPDKYAVEKKWVPISSTVLLFIIFSRISVSWAGVYREMSSVIFAFSAIAVATYHAKTKKTLAVQSLIIGFSIGIATIIRETSLLLIIPACLIVLTRKPKPTIPFVPRAIIIGAFALMGLFAGITPQLATNQIQRSTFTGKQFDAATQNLAPAATIDNPEETASSAGFACINLKRKIPRRLNVYVNTFQCYLVFFLAGLAIIICRRYLWFAITTIIPTTAYFLVYSAFDQNPGIPRYEMMIYLFAIPIIALGIVGIVEIIGKKAKIMEHQKLIIFIFSVITIALCTGYIYTTATSHSKNSPTTNDIKQFRQALAPYINNRSIVLCELSIRDYIEYLTEGSTASIQHFLEKDISIRELSNYCNKQNIDLFFFTAENNDLHSTPYAINEIQGLLEAEANLELMYTIPTNSSFAKTIVEGGNNLFRLSPLTNKVSNLEINNPYTSNALALIDIGSLPKSNTTSIASINTNICNILVNADRLLMLKIPPKTNTHIKITTTVPHRNNPIINIIPENSAISLRMGLTSAENFLLGEGWISNKRPSANGTCRRLPAYSSVKLQSLSCFYGGKASVFLNSYPITESKKTIIDISWSLDQKTWTPFKTAYYKNGNVSGFLIENIALDNPIYIRNKTNCKVYIHTFSIAKPASAEKRSSTKATDIHEQWCYLRINNQKDIQTIVDVSQIPPDFIPISGETIIPLYKMPCMLNTKLTVGIDNMLIEPIFYSGFYRAEKNGRWTSPTAKLLLPPEIIANGGAVSLYVKDQKPSSKESDEVSILFNNKVLYHSSGTNHSALNTIKCKIPANKTGVTKEPYIVIKSTAWVPNSRDTRQLGIFLEHISFDQ